METELNEQLSELESPRWSVVTFEKSVASGLTYQEAAGFVAAHKDKTPSLCIITDDAARRMFQVTDKMRRERDAEVPAQTTFSDIL